MPPCSGTSCHFLGNLDRGGVAEAGADGSDPGGEREEEAGDDRSGRRRTQQGREGKAREGEEGAS